MRTGTLALLTFHEAPEFNAWLEQHAHSSNGAWLRFAKRGASDSTLTKTEAIDCALAHGWIDGQIGRLDEHYYKIRFTPRQPGSVWSQLNRERAERLIKAGKMRPRGLAEVEQARVDGRWQRAYRPQSRARSPRDFIEALAANRRALGTFEELDSANRYSVLYRLQLASTPDKRAKKISELIAMLARGETFHQRRRRRRKD